nr:MAG TPA_asm: hypothetical protein [Caudoviricetes sp.]
MEYIGQNLFFKKIRLFFVFRLAFPEKASIVLSVVDMESAPGPRRARQK